MHKPTPPKAAIRPEVQKLHGVVRTDEYAWLKDRSDQKVRKYIDRENAYADSLMRPTRKLQQKLYREIRGRLKENDMTVAVKDGPYEYYTRTRRGKQYPIHCRRPAEGGKEEVILDENVLARGMKYFSLGAAEINPDHTLLAYTVDTLGNERHTLRVRHIKSGKDLLDTIDSVSDVEWSADGAELIYTKENHPFPPRHVYLHTLGQSGRDRLLYEEKDPQWYVSVEKSRSKEYIFILAGNFDTTEVRVLPAHAPRAMMRLFAKRRVRVKYFPEHHAGHFYIMTNERAVNFKVMRTPIDTPERRYWKQYIAHKRGFAITGFMAFRSFFLLCARSLGSEELYTLNPRSGTRAHIKLPEGEHSVHLWPDIEYDSPYFRFSYSSFITPKTVYDCDAAARKLQMRKMQEVPRYDKNKYASKRIWVHSNGVKIPIVLAYAKSGRRPTPTMLEAYGAYGISSDPYFSITKLSLMDRGWLIALAHPRGGGEMGWQWHKQAKLMTKHRTYDDVIACAEHLIQRRYTTNRKLALIGGSAGGMMVGAVLNKRPELFQAAVAYVPAADIVTSMLDVNLGGTRLHYDETGDPRQPRVFRYLMKHSPYEGVRAAVYPALLVRANMNDIRTPYWEAAKWVARLRARKTDDQPLIMKTETVAGHFGRSGRYEWIKDRAFDFAFLLSRIS